MYTDLTIFSLLQQEMHDTWKQITPATSLLLCNHPTGTQSQHNTVANINAIFDLLMLMVHQ